MTKLLLSVDDVCEAIGVQRTKAYELFRSGEIESVKIGKLRRVTPEALEKYIARLSADARESVA